MNLDASSRRGRGADVALMARGAGRLKFDFHTGSWAYWVPAHFVNFRFIPGEQRLLYINCMQIMYNIFLSFLGNRDAPETVAEKKE